jgi:hypothetical protein
LWDRNSKPASSSSSMLASLALCCYGTASSLHQSSSLHVCICFKVRAGKLDSVNNCTVLHEGCVVQIAQLPPATLMYALTQEPCCSLQWHCDGLTICPCTTCNRWHAVFSRCEHVCVTCINLLRVRSMAGSRLARAA